MPHPRIPDVKVTEMRPELIKFELSNTDASMANALRRIIIAEVPTICIDRVDVFENTTVLPDEVIAHRLGLIPLRSDRPMKMWNYEHICTCEEGCNNCQAKLTLDVCYEPDLDNGDDDLIYTVTSKSINVLTPEDTQPSLSVVHFSSNDEELQSYEDGITIVKLGQNQRLKVVMHAIKGIAKEHAKWSPVATCAMKYDAIVKLNENILDGTCDVLMS
jgi:DNA-directed RNA polymerase II subunit RPB3